MCDFCLRLAIGGPHAKAPELWSTKRNLSGLGFGPGLGRGPKLTVQRKSNSVVGRNRRSSICAQYRYAILFCSQLQLALDQRYYYYYYYFHFYLVLIVIDSLLIPFFLIKERLNARFPFKIKFPIYLFIGI